MRIFTNQQTTRYLEQVARMLRHFVVCMKALDIGTRHRFFWDGPTTVGHPQLTQSHRQRCDSDSIRRQRSAQTWGKGSNRRSLGFTRSKQSSIISTYTYIYIYTYVYVYVYVYEISMYVCAVCDTYKQILVDITRLLWRVLEAHITTKLLYGESHPTWNKLQWWNNAPPQQQVG